MMIALLMVVSLGLLAVFVILLNGQMANKTSRKISTPEQSHRKTEEVANQTAAINLIADRIDQTKLSEIMSSHVISIQVDAPFSEVARMMRQNDIRHLPIVDDRSRLVGIITQRMLYQIRSPRKLIDGEWYYDEDILNDVILKNVMEKEVVSFQPYHSVGKALMKMTYSKCGGIPIVEDDNTLVGIVTRKDILKFTANIYQNRK